MFFSGISYTDFCHFKSVSQLFQGVYRGSAVCHIGNPIVVNISEPVAKQNASFNFPGEIPGVDQYVATPWYPANRKGARPEFGAVCFAYQVTACRYAAHLSLVSIPWKLK
jgi:hypothetical protein